MDGSGGLNPPRRGTGAPMHGPPDYVDTSVDDVVRAPIPGPSPVPGAQWDEVHAHWEVWDRARACWHVVATAAPYSPVPDGEDDRPPADLDAIFAAGAVHAAASHRTDDDEVVIDLRSLPEPRGHPAGTQWNEVVGRWERWDGNGWVPAPVPSLS